MSSTVHTYPVGDIIEHDTDSDDCMCGPTTEAVECDDGTYGWTILHHSMDGREHHEPGHNRAKCPSCQAENRR